MKRAGMPCALKKGHAAQHRSAETLEKKRTGARQKNAKNPDRQRGANLKHAYNITLEEYNLILEQQGGKCAMCGRKPNGVRLHVDHDHSTRVVRGLLCWSCNRLLPNRKGLIVLFVAATQYLKDPPAVRVLGERKANKLRRRKKKVT